MNSHAAVPSGPIQVFGMAAEVFPGFTAERVLHRGGKAWVCAGVLDGRPAVVKVCTDTDPYWVDRFVREIRAYRYFTTTPPPVRTPQFLGTDVDRGVLAIEYLPGARLADHRYPTKPPADRDLAGLLDGLARLSRWTPDPAVFDRGGDYTARVARYQRHGILDDAAARAMMTLLTRVAGVPRVFAHGDALLTNALAIPTGVALLDWEFAGYLLPGYDHALLWTLLADHPDARRTVEHAVTDQAIDPVAFLINLAIVVTREIRLHTQLANRPERDHRLTTLHANWANIRARLLAVAASPPTR